jgi:hypothetical protein
VLDPSEGHLQIDWDERVAAGYRISVANDGVIAKATKVMASQGCSLSCSGELRIHVYPKPVMAVTDPSGGQRSVHRTVTYRLGDERAFRRGHLPFDHNDTMGVQASERARRLLEPSPRSLRDFVDRSAVVRQRTDNIPVFCHERFEKVHVQVRLEPNRRCLELLEYPLVGTADRSSTSRSIATSRSTPSASGAPR